MRDQATRVSAKGGISMLSIFDTMAGWLQRGLECVPTRAVASVSKFVTAKSWPVRAKSALIG